jgi:KDO2-lipid IV(A) lauroyltransferase
VDLLPLGVASWLVARLADLLFVLDRGRRAVAVENILRAGIETDRAAAVRLARRSARSFMAGIVETLKARRLLAGERWRDNVVLHMPSAVRAVFDDPESGLILVSGHFGNWEVGAQALSRFKPMVAAARKVSNPYVDRLLQRRKPSQGFRLVPEWFGSPTRYTEALKAGETLAVLIDLDARGEGIKLNFFGRPAATHVTVAMLHLVTKTPLVFVSCRRLGGGRVELVLSDLIEHRPTGDKAADVRAILTRLNGELETAIRRAPEQYLWAHSRWKYGEWEPPQGFVPMSGRLGPADRAVPGRGVR